MARLVVSLLAQADTAQIVTDLAGGAGHPVAARYAASFERLYERLTRHPESGAPRPAMGRHVRISIVSPYVVIYEHVAAEDTVTILRIAHGRRNITRSFVKGRDEKG
jgi:toxin ParE1/3/4